MRLLLRGGRIAGWAAARDLRVRGGRIAELGRGLAPGRRERVIDASEHVVLPGLVNAHDHLSLNLLPLLGEPPYANVYAFGEACYRPDQSPIRELMTATDVRDRLLWGGYKNLISGVTTVAHHDPFTRRVFHRFFPVKVVRRYGWAHSLGWEPDPRPAFRASAGAPFVIHAAEGVDERAAAEVDRLDELGLLADRTVLVHAIAVSPAQRARLAATGASVVWCPSSNLRLYGATADVAACRDAGVAVALGTDATMTGSPTLLDELRAARVTGRADDDELLAMVTTAAARIFALDDDRGTLAPGAPADLLLLPDAASSAAAALLAARPADLALVLVDGRPRLASPEIAAALDLGSPNVWIDGAPKRLFGDLAALRRRLARAAGAAALARGPLWSVLRASPPPTSVPVPESPSLLASDEKVKGQRGDARTEGETV